MSSIDGIYNIDFLTSSSRFNILSLIEIEIQFNA